MRDELGPCYSLINNAGILRAGGLDAVSLDDWNAVLAVNLTGYLLCARAFGAQMRAAGGGSIVHVASIAGLTPQTMSGAYSASKAGILLLSRQMAVEWDPQDIADVALFLASPRAAYVNGAEVAVDGGMSSMLMDMVPRPGFNKTS